MKRYFSFLILLGFLVLPLTSVAHVATVSTVQRTVIPAPVVKNYQPEKASLKLTVLKLGVKDPAVALLQGFLLNRGYNPGAIDGSFGKATENALKSFQRDSSGELGVDGVAGPQTLKYIESLPLVTNSQLVAGNTNANTNVSSTNTQPIKVTIPSLPNKVLSRALTAPSLIPISETNAVSTANKITAKPKLATRSGFNNAGIFVSASNNLNISGPGQANLNTNFSSGTSTANAKYVCGTKDGVQSCFVVTLEEAAQIEAGTLDVDQVLLAKTGGSQSGNCPSFYVNEQGNPGVTDQSWWNAEGCEESNINLALSGENVCLDGILFNQKTGRATGATCNDGLVSKTKTNLDRGAETCLTGTTYNPLTGGLCGNTLNTSVYVEQPPLICATGAKFNPFTGVACKPGSEIKPDSFANTLAGYAIRNLGSVTKGQEGGDVNIVQRVLANYGFLEPKYQTGFSGDITQAAVLNFQKSLGLQETGKVEGETLSYMKAAIVADPNLKNLTKVEQNVSKAQAAEKISTLLAKYPGGADISTQTVDTSVSSSSPSITPTSFALLNPTTGTDGPDTVGEVSCRRITSTQWAPGNYFHVRGYIGTNKLFYIPSNTTAVNMPKLKYTIPGETGPYPEMKVLAGSGLSGLYFSYVTKTGDGIPAGAYPSLFHQENKDIVFEVTGTDKIFTLSEDGKTRFSFDWTKLNDPNLPTCVMPSGGNGFRGIIRPDGTVGGVTGGTTGGGTPPPVPQCMDGIDNDNDGKIDFPTDPGCTSAGDSTENTDGGGGGGTALCADGIDNDGDTKIDFPADTGCTSATDTSESSEGGGTGGTIQDGSTSTFDEAGAPCPTSAPCHFWHCPSDPNTGQILQCNNWTPLRWAGSVPINFVIENNFTSPIFIEALDRVISDLNLLPNLHFTIQPGNGNCNGYMDQKRIPVCQGNYGQVGWSGVASMLPDFNNRLIRTGSVELNTTYLSTDINSDHAKATANLVICQEILHVTGVLHNDTPFSVEKKTCMDYYTAPWNNQHPNGFDAELLEIIYGTTSGGNGQKPSPTPSANLSNKFNQVMSTINTKDLTTWGVPTESTDGKIITHYEKPFVVDGKTYSISRHLYPIPPQ
ncbi:MAG: peptidoglycan-binding protein [Candidatus Pacebacteria bacterium]|nr:peptidoglycan-binding protein [Candidatus Paceibacterota bacterium]